MRVEKQTLPWKMRGRERVESEGTKEREGERVMKGEKGEKGRGN